MIDIFKLIAIFLILFTVGSVLLVVAFGLYIAASNGAEDDMTDDEKE